jgi:DNA-directed RNA polymerase specialized sigma24 family protein
VSWPRYKVCRCCRKRFTAPPGVGSAAFTVRKFCTASCLTAFREPIRSARLAARAAEWKAIEQAYPEHDTVTALAAAFEMRPSNMTQRLSAMRKAGFKLPYKNRRRLVDVHGVDFHIDELAEMLGCDQQLVRGRLYSGGDILALGYP